MHYTIIMQIDSGRNRYGFKDNNHYNKRQNSVIIQRIGLFVQLNTTGTNISLPVGSMHDVVTQCFWQTQYDCNR
jgi:hypothetical protein